MWWLFFISGGLVLFIILLYMLVGVRGEGCMEYRNDGYLGLEVFWKRCSGMIWLWLGFLTS